MLPYSHARTVNEKKAMLATQASKRGCANNNGMAKCLIGSVAGADLAQDNCKPTKEPRALWFIYGWDQGYKSVSKPDPFSSPSLWPRRHLFTYHSGW